MVVDTVTLETVNIAGKDYEVVLYSMDESWGPKYDPNRQVLHWWGAADYEQGHYFNT
jgi:hypothetical protein